MSLILNSTYHWQLPGGAELHSGDRVELFLDGQWTAGRIEYKPRKHYMLILDDDQELPVTEELQVRPIKQKLLT